MERIVVWLTALLIAYFVLDVFFWSGGLVTPALLIEHSTSVLVVSGATSLRSCRRA